MTRLDAVRLIEENTKRIERVEEVPLGEASGRVLAEDVVAGFNRIGTDGIMISLQQDSLTVGTISVAGSTVSYNPFTGSHYGWTKKPLERGTLVVLTGENLRLHESAESELVYGVARSSQANDPRCLGAYLAPLEEQRGEAVRPHQIMAVGNGDMWVVDTGRNIAPGDYLISSSLTGHAMLDEVQQFPVGHIIARAGEPVDWAKVPNTETTQGLKHRRISVFFESFERGLTPSSPDMVKQNRAIANLKSEIANLKELVGSLAAKNGWEQ